ELVHHDDAAVFWYDLGDFALIVGRLAALRNAGDGLLVDLFGFAKNALSHLRGPIRAGADGRGLLEAGIAEVVHEDVGLAALFVHEHVLGLVAVAELNDALTFDAAAGAQLIERILHDRRAGKRANEILLAALRIGNDRANRGVGFPFVVGHVEG